MGVLLALVVAAPAYAQSRVAARTGEHEDYTRLVLEWNDKPAYTISKQEDRVTVRFSKSGALDAAGMGAGKSVLGIKTISSASEPLQVAITIPSNARFRDFTVENRFVLDVYHPAAPAKEAKPAAAVKPPAKAAAPVPKAAAVKRADTPKAASKPAGQKTEPPRKGGGENPAPASSPAPAPSPSPVASAQEIPAKEALAQKEVAQKQGGRGSEAASKPGEQKPDGDFSKQAAMPAPAVEVPHIERRAVEPPALADHEITLAAIFSVGMAAYERNGSLWIILDTQDQPAVPVLKGPQAGRFGLLTPVAIEGGAAYRVDLPEGVHAYGEGGGLAWKILLTQKEREIKPVLPYVDAPRAGEPDLVWPMESMRKVMTLRDPVAGDEVSVVTGGRASQYAGPARDFAQLGALNSIIGLAYVPKTDDIEARLTTRQVRVGREGGLALSSSLARSAPPPDAEAGSGEAAPETPPEATPPPDADVEAGRDPSAPSVEEAAESGDGGAANEAQLSTQELAAAAAAKPSGNNIYNFPRWEMGGLQALRRNLHTIMMDISSKPEDARISDILTAAKVNLANHRGAEALGLMRIALQKTPALESSVEFQALRGLAFALSGKFDEAIVDFSNEELRKYDDVKFWRVYTLAGLEDWKQAIEELPSDLAPVSSYPRALRVPLSLSMAEIALRAAKIPMAQSILKVMEADLPELSLSGRSAWAYLSGEAARQAGKEDEAVRYWEKLAKDGKDDLYRAKAGLSLTRLEMERKNIKPEEAIDRLEGLRYAWRGDELETLINYRLGVVYVDHNDYLKGLTVLRNAAGIAPSSETAKEAKAYLAQSFRRVFADNKLGDVPPMEAIALYEEFKDLTPPGPEGDGFVETLAERLVQAELLGRAASLLEHHVNNRLQGDRRAEVAIRLAAIRLLDGNAGGALRSLDVAQAALDRAAGRIPQTAQEGASLLPPQTGAADQAGPQGANEAASAAAAAAAAAEIDPLLRAARAERQRQIRLLRARALSMEGKADEALEVLESMVPDVDVNRLKTDIAWTAGKWEEAAFALNDLLAAEDISSRRPLNDYQRELIFNRAIALNLSGNRVALANLRERYNAHMAGTPRGQMFEIVTRSRRPDMVGTRDAIENMISEIDMFQGFLDGYSRMSRSSDMAAEPETIPAENATGSAEAPPAQTQSGQN